MGTALLFVRQLVLMSHLSLDGIKNEIKFLLRSSAELIGNENHLYTKSIKVKTMKKKSTEKQTQGLEAGVEQTKHPAISREDKEKKIKENEITIKQLTNEILSGKCPIRVIEREGKVDINAAIHKEDYDTPFAFYNILLQQWIPKLQLK